MELRSNQRPKFFAAPKQSQVNKSYSRKLARTGFPVSDNNVYQAQHSNPFREKNLSLDEYPDLLQLTAGPCQLVVDG